jgi:hypothetical protein
MASCQRSRQCWAPLIASRMLRSLHRESVVAASRPKDGAWLLAMKIARQLARARMPQAFSDYSLAICARHKPAATRAHVSMSQPVRLVRPMHMPAVRLVPCWTLRMVS